MERMTQWFGTGDNRVAGLAPEHEEQYTVDELIDVLLDKLARYEDTGLEPEQITTGYYWLHTARAPVVTIPPGTAQLDLFELFSRPYK